ncbi:MAG: hypothetical protein HY710_07365 [Candidatus Latescibacteria bacterium]|nr:hypothetical protein [Candidatus Latescibacterota bacterium]
MKSTTWITRPVTMGMVILLLVSGIACNQNMKPLPESGAAPAAVAENAGDGGPQSPEASSMPGGGGTVSGTLSIAPDLAAKVNGTEVIFLIARRPEGGPPLAVKKIDHPQFPLSYTLGSADAMLNEPFAGEVMIVARLDRDGNAGPPQPGDMEGTVIRAQVGDAGVNIVIDRMK